MLKTKGKLSGLFLFSHAVDRKVETSLEGAAPVWGIKTGVVKGKIIGSFNYLSSIKNWPGTVLMKNDEEIWTPNLKISKDRIDVVFNDLSDVI